MPIDLEKKPSQIFSKKLASIRSIQNIQSDLRKAEVNKIETKIGYLEQSYIFHLVAFWQVFVEDLVEFGFERLEKSSVASPFTAIARNRMKASLKRFNTPKRQNMDVLFDDALGIAKITCNWSDEEAMTLSDVLDARHSIAHKGFAGTSLSYDSNFAWMNVIFKLAEITEKRMLTHLHEAHGIKL